MKIALLTTGYFPEYHGASLRVDGLARGLHAHGHEVFIFTPGRTLKKERLKYCTVYRLPLRRSFLANLVEKYTKFHLLRYFCFLKHLRWLIKEEGIELIHTRQPLDLFLVGRKIQQEFALPWATEAHKLLSVTDFESGTMSRYHKNLLLWIERRLMNKSNLVVTMTASGKKTLQHYGIHVPLVIVPNASQLSLTKPGPHPFHGKRYILYAGTLREVEGLDHLLSAFSEIHKTMPELTLLMIGGGDVEKYKRMTLRLGLNNHVIFLGEVDYHTLASYYAHADLFVYPRKDVTYHHDIIGLKVYDALSMELPLVTSDVGETAELLRKHHLGKLSKPEDDYDFARCVLALLKNKKEYAALRKNARQLTKNFCWESSCETLSAAYQKLFRSHKA